MANQDTVLYLGTPGGPANVNIEVHLPLGQASVSNNPSDFGFVDPSQAGYTVLGVPVVATKLTIAGVRFSNPA